MSDQSIRDTSLNIFQRMMMITAELERVSKSAEVGYGKNKYKAVLESDILDAVKPLECKYGVYSFPVSRKSIVCDILEQESTTTDDNGNQFHNTKAQFIHRVETTYRFVNVDDPEDYLETTSYGDGIDAADKAPGKAMTYSDKYALMKAYKIVTGDDPDQNASPDYSRANLRSSAPQQQPRPQAAQRPVQPRQPQPAQTLPPPVPEPLTPPPAPMDAPPPADMIPPADMTEDMPLAEAAGKTIREVFAEGGRPAVIRVFRSTADPGVKSMITNFMNSMPAAPQK